MDGLFSAARTFVPNAPAPAPRFTGHPRYNFVGGHNDPDLVPAEELADCAAKVLRDNGHLLGIYSLGQAPQGHDRLRDFVVGKLAARSGIQCTRDDILLTSGSLQGLDLVNAVMVGPGDTVIMEEFTYGGSISRIARLGGRVVGAKLDEGGIVIDALRDTLSELRNNGVRPRYLYTIPTVQNPTGSIMSLERRRALLALAREFEVPVFEDECYADLVWAGTRPPALYALDPANVVHIGSFSKSLAPALRIGYVVAGWDMLGRLIAAKTDAGSGALEQMVVAEYVDRSFDRHVDTLRAGLKAKLDVMTDALNREFGTAIEIHHPEGGIFVWITFPDGVDVRTFAAAAQAEGVAFNPGPEWSCDPEAARNKMRLCFALPDEETIRSGIAELARISYEHTGIPSRSGNRTRP